MQHKMQYKMQLKLTLLGLVILLSACTSSQLNYRLDPEIRNIHHLSNYAKLIAISVIDNRMALNHSLNGKTILANGPQNEAAMLKKKLIENLKKNHFKIISNSLLADLSIKITIEKLEAKVTQSLLKSSIHVESHLRLEANKQSQKIEKLYKMDRTQEVANPANERDVTGVVNQLLSNQLSNIFSDQRLKSLAAKNID